MTNLIRSSIALAALASTAAITGCATGDYASYVPLQQIHLNSTYSLNSQGNAAGIAAFVGAVNNSEPHASMGEDYYSDVTGTLTIQPAGGGSACSTQQIQLTGKLTNVKDGVVNIEMTGDVAGGSMAVSGTVINPTHGNTDPGNQFYGSYSINGGSCAVAATGFTAVPVGSTSTTVTTKH